MRRLVAACLGFALASSTVTAYARKGPRYDPEQPVPAGYHVEDRPQIALAITGGALAATGAGCIVWGLTESAKERRDYDARRAADPSFEGDAGFTAGQATLYLGIVMAAVGAPLLVVGLATKRSVLVPDHVAIAPIATPSFGGLAVAATF